jgi:hypothetical protein
VPITSNDSLRRLLGIGDEIWTDGFRQPSAVRGFSDKKGILPDGADVFVATIGIVVVLAVGDGGIGVLVDVGVADGGSGVWVLVGRGVFDGTIGVLVAVGGNAVGVCDAGMGVFVMRVVADGEIAVLVMRVVGVADSRIGVLVAIVIGLDGSAVSVKRVGEVERNGGDIGVLVVF